MRRISRPGFSIESLEGRCLLSGLAVTYNTNGLSTLAYNSDTLINVPALGGGYQIEGYYTLNSDGSYTHVSASYTTSWDSSSNTLTAYLSFGTVSVTYTQVNANRLNMNFTVVNNANSGVTLGGVEIYPNQIHFPNPLPVSYVNNGVNTWAPLVDSSVAGPNVVPANYQSGSMAFVNDSDVTKEIYTSLYTLDNTTGENYYLWVGTGPKYNQNPNATPLYYRNTAPGQTDSFEESLRFGPAGTDPLTLAPDVEQAYAAAYPDTINAAWSDRRAIASLHLTSPPTHPLNPEGWFNNSSTIDTTTTAGLNNFASTLLTYAATSIAQMQQQNAQGMIVWDLEGQRWPQATSYIGDPRVATSTGVQANQEMAYNYNGNGQLIDQFFAMFRQAGFRTGMTIRPTQITFTYNSSGVATSASQQPADELTELESKISYAYNRWGSTLFYLDSNSGYDSAVLAQVQRDYPQVLVIPEHSTTGTYASTAPYGQWLTYNYDGPPEITVLTYPNAFGVIYPADGNSTVNFAPTEASIATGSIILFRGWFADTNYEAKPFYTPIVTSLPDTPTGVVAKAGDGVVNLSWNAVTSGGTGNPKGLYNSGVYNVYRSTSPSFPTGPSTALIASGIFTTSYSDTTATQPDVFHPDLNHTVVNNTTYYYEVTAVNGQGEGSRSTAVSAKPNPAPTVVTAANSTPTTVTATTANLSVLGGSNAGESTLSYTWSSSSTPANLSQPTYSVNGTNAAKNATATFHQAGTFTLKVTITDGNGLTTTSSVNVTVNQTFTAVSVTPGNGAVAGGGMQTFTPASTDQFGNAMTSPTITWSVTGGGSINSSGVFTANQTGGTYSVTATNGSIHGSTNITVVPTVYIGTSSNETLAIRLSPSDNTKEQVFVNTVTSGSPTYTIALAQYPGVTFNSDGGNDSLTVDFSNGNPLPPTGVNFNGGSNGTAGDSLIINGISSGNLSFTINGTQVVDSAAPAAPIVYSNIENVQFNLLGGTNSLTQLAQPNGAVTYNAGTGNNSLTINGGNFTLTGDPQTTSGNLTVNDNAALTFATGSGINARHLASLTLGAGATAVVSTPASESNRAVLVLGAMTLNASAQLDLGGNDLILHSSAANRAADQTRLNGYLKTGYNSGQWNGLGVESSTAHSDPSHLKSLGYILNDDGSNPGGVGNPAFATFDGQSALATDLLVKFTYDGDADLTGHVDGNDYSLIDSGFKMHTTGWRNGDFNYDGSVDGSDYSLIDNAFNTQGATLAAIIAANVAAPAPSTLFQSKTPIGSKSVASTVAVSPTNEAFNSPAVPPPMAVDDLLDGLQSRRRR
jgi:hypothetical protein